MFQQLLLIITLLLITHLWSESTYTPLGKPYPLSSSYLENRGSRYHAGFDFPTDDTVGIVIRAPEHGFVSRIKISPFGYGKALYFQSDTILYVFAHLDGFAGTIQKKVRLYQNSIQSNDIDWRPKKRTVRFKKGEIIAYSGSTGIGIPHLHFETRTGSPQTISPAPFVQVIDTVPPDIAHAAIIYDDGSIQRFDNIGQIFQLPSPIQQRALSKILLYITDFADGVKENPMSIAKLSLHCNDTLIYQKSYQAARYGTMSEIRHELLWSIEDSLSPQGDWHNLGSKTQHTTHFSQSPITCTQSNDTLTAIVEDFLHNQSTVYLTFSQSKEYSRPSNVPLSPWGNQDSTLFTYMGFPYLALHNNTIITSRQQHSTALDTLNRNLISIPSLLVDDSTLSQITITPQGKKPRTVSLVELKQSKHYRTQRPHWQLELTPEVDAVLTMEFNEQLRTLTLHPKGLPIKKKINVCVSGNGSDSSWILQYLTETKREWSTFSRITRKSNQLCTQINELRDIRIVQDTTPPVVKGYETVSCKKYEQCHSKLLLYLTKDLSGFSSGNQIAATIDGEWVPHYYDNEEEHIAIELPDMSGSSKNTVAVTFTDDASNKKIWNRLITVHP
ncbi:MAG: M23 family metallopeptidase [Fibrobacterales bacterium]